MKVLGISTQLYVWSQVKGANKSLGDQLNDVAEAGYDGAEFGLNLVSDSPKVSEIKTVLDRLSLKVSSLYSGGVFHDPKTAGGTIEEITGSAGYAMELGVPSITVNPASVKGGGEKTDDELKIQAENLDKLGEELKKLGMALYLHNHTPEIVNNAREFRSYLDLTDPELVNACIDVHWVLRGGADPFELTKQYASRIKAMHVRNSKDGVWSEDFSDGDIDYRAYKKLMGEIDYTGWVTVELAYESSTEMTRSFLENLKFSCEYARRIFGG
ncbi:TIM barrel protein [Candidatus Poribacteria bacterium]|nr:TIM barrel protein [Candidatus Poribacteria bacterium]